MRKVLIVDDEPDIRELVRYALEKEGFAVEEARDGQEALDRVRTAAPEAMVLDLMLPKLDGLEVVRRLRADKAAAHLPILLLTAKDTETDRVVGLELGADDYVVKPFSPRELVVRVKALLRRVARPPQEEGGLALGPIKIDVARREVHVEGKDVGLTTTEFNLLKFMADRPGRALTRQELINGAIGENSIVTDRTVDAHVAAVRRKLGAEASVYVETIRGYGYRFKER